MDPGNVYLGFVLVPFCSMDGVFVFIAIMLMDDWLLSVGDFVLYDLIAFVCSKF